MSKQGEIQTLVGRTITKALFVDDNKDEWGHHGDYWLWLDDGRVVAFGSVGYDADSPTFDEIEVIEITDCLHCHKAHGLRELSISDSKWDIQHGVPEGKKYAWCTTGNHIGYIEGDTIDGP